MPREPILTDPGAADPLSGPPKAHSVHDAEVVEVTERNRTRVFDVRDYGAVGDGVANDTDAFDEAIVEAAAGPGKALYVPVGNYLVPDGIDEAVQGLVVIGEGHRYIRRDLGAGPASRIITTAPGAYTWRHRRSAAVGDLNDYIGPRFENLVFAGGDDTRGGLRVEVNSARVANCSAENHKAVGATGFEVGVDGGISDDASWFYFESCFAVDCRNGFDFGVLASGESGGSAGGQVVGCVSLKTTAGGIKHTGIGTHIRSGNTTILGGKDEGNDVGTLITAPDGVTMLGRRFEGQGSIGVHLNRPSGSAFSSRHKLIGLWFSTNNPTRILVGENQSLDEIIGCENDGAGTGVVDNGTNTTIILGGTVGQGRSKWRRHPSVGRAWESEGSLYLGQGLEGGPAFIDVQQHTVSPGAPAAGRGRLWFQNSGPGGKMQLRVQFPTGAVQVVAEEP